MASFLHAKSAITAVVAVHFPIVQPQPFGRYTLPTAWPKSSVAPSVEQKAFRGFLKKIIP
jgi:hypothetical protein